jgi:hypothetical protein
MWKDHMIPMCRSCGKYPMVKTDRGDYFCSKCWFCGDPAWKKLKPVFGVIDKEATNGQ